MELSLKLTEKGYGMKKTLLGRSRCFCLCVFFSVIFAAPGVFGQTMDDDIVKLLRLTGTATMADQLVGTMVTQFQAMNPNIPPAFWVAFKRRMNIEEFLRMCVPIYARHYSHDEIRQLIQFYESPIGRKTVSVMPAMLQETMAVGQKWGEKLGVEVIAELRSAGF